MDSSPNRQSRDQRCQRISVRCAAMRCIRVFVNRLRQVYGDHLQDFFKNGCSIRSRLGLTMFTNTLVCWYLTSLNACRCGIAAPPRIPMLGAWRMLTTWSYSRLGCGWKCTTAPVPVNVHAFQRRHLPFSGSRGISSCAPTQ